MHVAGVQTGPKICTVFPKRVKSYKTGHCHVLKNITRHRVLAPWICGLPALQAVHSAGLVGMPLRIAGYFINHMGVFHQIYNLGVLDELNRC